MSGVDHGQTPHRPTNQPGQPSREQIPQTSDQDSDKSSASEDDRLHSRDEAGPTVTSRICPLPLPQNEAGDEEEEPKQADTSSSSTKTTKAGASNQNDAPQPEYYLPYPPPPVIQGEEGTNQPPTCAHGVHDPTRAPVCSTCLADLEAELQQALRQQLRRCGWSAEQIHHVLDGERGGNNNDTDIPMSMLLPNWGEEGSSYLARANAFQASVTEELNRRMGRAEEALRAEGTSTK